MSVTLTNKCSWEQDQRLIAAGTRGSYVKATQADNPSRVSNATQADGGDSIFSAARSDTSGRVQNATQADSEHNQGPQTACQHDLEAVLLDAQQLFATAKQMVRQSCQEDWLLQPYIPNIEEYR